MLWLPLACFSDCLLLLALACCLTQFSLLDRVEKLTGVRCKKTQKKHRKIQKNAGKRKKTQKKVEKQGNPQKSDPLEAPWARPGHVLVALGHSWCPLGRLLEALETPLGRSWSLLGASWTPLPHNLEKRLGGFLCWSPTWRPKSIQVGSKIQEKSM